ncbi:MAG: choice-of-anchor D domain-containing protein [Myxococcaceae bacterium]
MQVLRVLGRLAMVTAALCLAACQDPEKLRPVSAIAAFDPVAVDFGQVPVGTWRSQLVRVRNIGYVPFSVEEVQLLGGDASYQLEPGEVRVGPGQESVVTLRFHPLEEGPINETLTLSTDADINPTQQLSVSGHGGPAGIVIEPSLLDFQAVELDSDRTIEVTVQNPSDLPLTLVLSGDDAWQFEPGERTVGPLATSRFGVRYHPALSGPVRAQLEARPCARCTAAIAPFLATAVPSAFSFDPSPVPFEPVPVHASTLSSTRATNVTWRPVELSAISTNEPSFTTTGPSPGLVVGPGESFPIEVGFSARHDGPSMARLSVDYLSDRQRSSQVALDASGGLPQLALAPLSLDFGTLPVGGKTFKVVRISNAGTSGDLLFKGVQATGDTGSFGVSEPSRGTQSYPWQPGSAWPNLVSPGVPIAPGLDYVDVKVYFQPARRGELAAQLVFGSDDRFHPERTVILTGRSYEVGPCVFKVLPEGLLDFGNVPAATAGSGAVLGFRFENAGLNPCAVKDIFLSNTGGGAFFMPGGSLAGGVVLRDDSFAAMIGFRPPSNGSFEGELSLTVNNPVDPVFHLPIRGTSTGTCLSASPNYLDFGAIRYDCQPQPLHTRVSNGCSRPLVVGSVEVGPGTSNQFTSEAPATPLTLPPGGVFEVKASYSRTVHGQHYSPLWIRAVGEPAPFLVPMIAETNHEGLQQETFVQGTDHQLDVLFVVSNTTTMSPYQSRLSADIPGWIQAAVQRGVDLRAGVTTTGLVPKDPSCPGGAMGGEAGRLFRVDGSNPRLVSSAWPTAAGLLQRNLEVGTCHNLVQGLETMRAALSPPLVDSADDPRTPLPDDGNLGLLRSTARLAVVFLADEDDHSGFDPQSYVTFLRTLKGPGMAHRTSAQAIVPTDPGCVTAGPPGPRFSSVAAGTGGEALSVCAPSYGALLGKLITRAAGPQADFLLAAVPSSTTEIVVTVDGVASPPGAWRFDAPTRSIVFAPGSVPLPGQTVRVQYRSVCPGTP